MADGFIKSFIKDNALQILSLVMLGLATYITFRLAPLTADINSLKSDVQAVKIELNDHDKSVQEFLKIQVKVEEIGTRLERIDNRLSKHLGI